MNKSITIWTEDNDVQFKYIPTGEIFLASVTGKYFWEEVHNDLVEIPPISKEEEIKIGVSVLEKDKDYIRL